MVGHAAREHPATLAREGSGFISTAESECLRVILDGFPAYALLVSESHDILLANETVLRDLGSPLVRAVQGGSESQSELYDAEHDCWIRAVTRLTPFRDRDGRKVHLHVASTITDRRPVEAQQSELIDLVINSQDAERRRLARELHDEPVQALAWVILRLQRLAENAGAAAKVELCELQRFVETTAEGLRRLAYGLHPSLLEDLGLHAALEWHVEDFSKANDTQVDLHIAGLDQDARLPRAVEVMLYRVVQEALANVAQHSGAKHASVVIDRRGAELQLIIEDDGCGIEADKGYLRSGRSVATSARRKLGLISIRERVALLCGVVTIESRPEGGTTLYVKVPIEGQHS